MMKRRTLLSILTVGCAAGSVPGVLWGAAAPQPLTQMYQALADARRATGMGLLTRQSVLMSVTGDQALHMRAMGQATHLDASGHSPDARAQRLGYGGRVLGEVLAETYGPPGDTLEGWLENPSSRAVLLDPEARDLGLAIAQGHEGRIWWTLVTGAP